MADAEQGQSGQSAADIAAAGDAGTGRQLPVAIVEQSRGTASMSGLFSRMWLLTAVCLAVAIGLVVWNQKPAGPTIRIHFEQGYGLRAGNSLLHRGIEAGQVSSIKLDSGGAGVVVGEYPLPVALGGRRGQQSGSEGSDVFNAVEAGPDGLPLEQAAEEVDAALALLGGSRRGCGR